MIEKQTKKKTTVKRNGPKGMGLKQLMAKKYKMLTNMPPEIVRTFGRMTEQVLMFISGPTGSGKSRLVMLLLKYLMQTGDVMYVSPEEGHRWTMQESARVNLNEQEHSGKITFWDHTMTYEELVIKLKKKRSPKYVVIDSLQYWNMGTKERWMALKAMFSNKGFIIISHSKGRAPLGKLACDIEYDVDIKVRVEGFVAEVRARGNGLKHFVIFPGAHAEEGAWLYWGKRKVNRWLKQMVA
jgi:hypothetical protein